MYELFFMFEFVFENFFLDVIGCCGNRFGRLKFVDLFGDVLFIMVKIYFRIFVIVYGGGGMLFFLYCKFILS